MRMRTQVSAASKALGSEDTSTLKLRWLYANALSSRESASLDELSEAVTMLEMVGVAFRRRFGEGHPELEPLKDDLSEARRCLATARAALGS